MLLHNESESVCKERHSPFPDSGHDHDFSSDFHIVVSKEAQGPKFIYDYTPRKCVLGDRSQRSSPPGSFLKRLGQMSPFFTTQAKQDSSTLSPQAWHRLTSQAKVSRLAVPFERLFQRSDVKPMDSFEFRVALPFTLQGEEPPAAQPSVESKDAGQRKNPGAGCNCRNSRCLKLYCECLRKKEFCVGCNCVGCENTADSKFREDRVRFIEKKNPLAFQPLVMNQKTQGKMLNQKGCNCRRSNCQKNYCECHQFGISCGEFCKCKDCKNVKEPAKKLGKKIVKTRPAAGQAKPKGNPFN